jgi:RNA polymerase subunit RPABC4/transcription elongation factor Spt4
MGLSSTQERLWRVCAERVPLEASMTTVLCAGCGTTIEDPSAPRCPICGSTSRLLSATDSAKAHELAGLKARHDPKTKPFREVKAGDDFCRDRGKWVDRVVSVDRENDQYAEKVTDKETGEVIHQCQETLRQHRGHGPARPRK